MPPSRGWSPTSRLACSSWTDFKPSSFCISHVMYISKFMHMLRSYPVVPLFSVTTTPPEAPAPEPAATTAAPKPSTTAAPKPSTIAAPKPSTTT